MNTVIIDYGMGNLGSVRRACESLGAKVHIAKHPSELSKAQHYILPGVGSFSIGMDNLNTLGFTKAIIEGLKNKEKVLLGICLGMQLLATRSEEGGTQSGLNLIPGDVKKIDKLGCNLPIPHVGWNEVAFKTNNPLCRNIKSGTDFYFVHSYSVTPYEASMCSAVVKYDVNITAVLQNENIFGVQFHPEKSSKAGLFLLKNFLEFKAC